MQALKLRMPSHCDLHRFACEERGATAIEYGLIAALIAIAMLAGLKALGDGNSGSWGNTANTVSNAMSN